MTTKIYADDYPIIQFRKDLIIWAQNQATGQRTQAAIGKTKKHHDEHTHKAESYDFVATYLEGIEIVSHSPLPKINICPDTDRPCEENCGTVDCHLKLSKAGLFG